MKRIYISVTNDLVSDQRVHKVATTLVKMGFEVKLIGRLLKNKENLNRSYKTHRFKLLFTKGPLFYAEYNVRLFLFLLINQYEFLLSNDLDTLLANYLVSKIRNKPLVYDSHEYYTGTPELANRSLVRKIWKSIENYIFPRLKYIYTVNRSIANLYATEYCKSNITVIRNVAPKFEHKNILTREKLNIPIDKKIVILQGAGINIDRGAEELIQAMQYTHNIVLYIIGNGYVIDILRKMVDELNIQEKVIIKPRLPYTELMQYTCNANLGITLDKDTNINYHFSLPNKVFDYIQAGIPVLSSDLPELSYIIRTYNIGDFIENHTPKHIADKITEMVFNEEAQVKWKSNTTKAAQELCWENEELKLIELYNKILNNEQ